MKHLYRVSWDIKTNKQEIEEYCFVEANNAKEAKKKFLNYGYHNSLYNKNRHAFHIEAKRDDNAANIPVNIFIIAVEDAVDDAVDEAEENVSRETSEDAVEATLDAMRAIACNHMDEDIATACFDADGYKVLLNPSRPFYWLLTKRWTHIMYADSVTSSDITESQHTEWLIEMCCDYYYIDPMRNYVDKLFPEEITRRLLSEAYYDENGNRYYTEAEAVEQCAHTFDMMDNADLRKCVLGLKEDYVPAVYRDGRETDIYNISDWVHECGARHALRNSNATEEDIEDLFYEFGEGNDYAVVFAYYKHHKA